MVLQAANGLGHVRLTQSALIEPVFPPPTASVVNLLPSLGVSKKCGSQPLSLLVFIIAKEHRPAIFSPESVFQLWSDLGCTAWLPRQ